MLEFSHEKSIRFICCFRRSKWQIESIAIDPDIDLFFKRNGFVLIEDSSLPPSIHMSRILQFLFENKMDEGSVFQRISDEEEEFIIVVKAKSTSLRYD